MKKKPLPPVFNALVEEYHRHLVDCAGLAGATCRNHIHYVRRFLRENRKKLGRQLGFHRLRAPDLLAYVRHKSRSFQPGSLHGITTTLRSFFRFLSLTGRCPGSLSGAVPKVSGRRGGGLPRHLTPEQLKQLLQSLSQPKPGAVRSRAIVLCLSKLGLRAGEVARLRLDDINWRSRTLSLPSTKGRRSRLLPLTDQVARALVGYLRQARPASPHREVFLSRFTHRPLSSLCISQLTAQALRQAGIECSRPGAHLLRHTFATHLIRRGASLKALADLLGHRRLDTTTVYAKVNVPMLAQVAQPWPEEVA